MSRQMKISEEVYTMLWCLKPFPSTSFNDVISGIIEDVVPFLPIELKRIRELEKENPELAASELEKLQKITFDHYTVDRLLRKKEREDYDYGKDGYY
jgi:predicted CopG family antitoxin